MFDFKKMFEQASTQAASEYLYKKGLKSKEYQELSKIQENLFNKIVNKIDQTELLYQYEETNNAIFELYQKWTYQKAFYDYTFLLRKMGVYSSDIEQPVDFTVEEGLYKKLYQLADKHHVSIDCLVQLCCEYSLRHVDEFITDEMRKKE